MTKIKIKGYRRGKKKFGIRNHAIALSSVSCVNSFVEQACLGDSKIIPVAHQHGCDHIGKDREQVLRTLVGVCNHPNVGGVLLVGLGCENVSTDEILKLIDRKGKIIRRIVVQKIGSKKKIFGLINRYLKEIKSCLSKQKQEEFDLSNLVVGLECGGSDPFSGITGNPTVGKISDKLVREGATVILSEIPELIGAKNALKKIIKNKAVKKKLFSRIDDYIETAKNSGCDLIGVNPTPGNVRAGLSSIEEKALGCASKAGTSNIREFVEYGKEPTSKGLVVMDTPGNDPESVTGMIAGGAHLVLFTTGLGTPMGNPVAPVIKVATNTKIYQHMKDYLDLNAGKIIEGASIDEVSEEIFDFLIKVANGKKAASEKNKNREFSINRIAPTF